MLGNSSNKHSEVLPKRGFSDSMFVRLGLEKSKQNTPQHQANARQLWTPLPERLDTHGLLRKTWAIGDAA